jgi:hypothetical protein
MTGFEEFMISRQTFDGVRYLMLIVSLLLTVRVLLPHVTGQPVQRKPRPKVRKTKQKVSEILSS